jgi:hypothetical protein
VTSSAQKPLTLKQAAGIAGVSPDTMARWCKRYGIGRQLHPKAPWRVDPAGLEIVVTGDAEALSTYNAGRRPNGNFTEEPHYFPGDHDGRNLD